MRSPTLLVLEGSLSSIILKDGAAAINIPLVAGVLRSLGIDKNDEVTLSFCNHKIKSDLKSLISSEALT